MDVILRLLLSAVLPRLCFAITSLVCKLPFCLPMRLDSVVTRSLVLSNALNAQLPILTAIMIGIVTACGGGLLRDVLVSDEPLLFKPGQLYVLAALIGASLFTLLILYFKMPA